MTDLQKRYAIAAEEAAAARVEWNEAEIAMARANARRTRAEREIHHIFMELMDQANARARTGAVGGPST